MNQNKLALMKLFSLILKERSKAEAEYREINPDMVKFFSRKELIEIITKIFDGNVPQEHNLVELENDGLLKIIGDDLYIISYVTEKWSKEVASLPLKPVHPILAKSQEAASASTNSNSSASKKQDPKKEEDKKS